MGRATCIRRIGRTCCRAYAFYRLRLSPHWRSLFLPLAWNAVNLSAVFRRAERRKSGACGVANLDGMNDSKDAEAMGALVATLVVGGIIVFAICAGIFNESVSFDNLIGIAIGFLVVGAFAVVVFMDPLSQLMPVRWLSRVFGFAARAAPGRWRPSTMRSTRSLSGSWPSWPGMEHRSVAARYGILGLMLVSLCLLGWYLPPGWGLMSLVRWGSSRRSRSPGSGAGWRTTARWRR
jgi:hypothetical protein